MNELAEIPATSWDELLSGQGLTDVYLRHGYVVASCEIDAGRPMLLYLEERRGSVAFPLILRDVPDDPGTRDVTTAYGYGGPVGTGADPPWSEFHEAYERWCELSGVVTTFVRFHPLFANHAHAGAGMSVVPMSGTIAWRLANRELFAHVHKHHRRLVRKAKNAGMELRISERPNSLGSFRELYEATMHRRRASSHYFFRRPYWDSLLQNVGDSVVLFEAILEGQTLAAILCLGGSPWFHYHLGASDDAGRTVGASHFLLLEAATWAQARGCSVFHLGGGVGGKADDLLEFKRRFDPGGLVPSFVGAQIHRPATYRQLSGADDAHGFFPAYRAAASPARSH
jgi:serine/alanine adding enzyme